MNGVKLKLNTDKTEFVIIGDKHTMFQGGTHAKITY